MNVHKNNVKRISRQPSPAQIMTNQKQPESVDYLNYLESMVTSNKEMYS
jgi:hypothetical protein